MAGDVSWRLRLCWEGILKPALEDTERLNLLLVLSVLMVIIVCCGCFTPGAVILFISFIFSCRSLTGPPENLPPPPAILLLCGSEVLLVTGITELPW